MLKSELDEIVPDTTAGRDFKNQIDLSRYHSRQEIRIGWAGFSKVGIVLWKRRKGHD